MRAREVDDSNSQDKWLEEKEEKKKEERKNSAINSREEFISKRYPALTSSFIYCYK